MAGILQIAVLIAGEGSVIAEVGGAVLAVLALIRAIHWARSAMGK